MIEPDEKVTAKASEQKHNKSWSVDDEHLRRTSGYIRHSLVGRILYGYMMFLMFIEGVWWSLMDTTRAHRMRVAKKIINNKHDDRV